MTRKRILALILMAVMLVSLNAFAVWAVETEDPASAVGLTILIEEDDSMINT